MPPAEPVLICGLSGRALAQSAQAVGYAPIVLDAFADLDTLGAAEACRRVPVDTSWRLRRGPLLAAAAGLAPAPIPLVWGSGFERAPALLAELAKGRPLWGCAPELVRAVKDPLGFAATARRLGIAHPETRATRPDDMRGWLLKRRGAAGGGHVRRAGLPWPRGQGWYWQRMAPGRPVSALVAGDGIRAAMLGTSEQWAVPVRGRPFRFGGVVAPARLSDRAATRLREGATSLAAHYGIIGIASVDALVAGDEVTVLEINPRPGASLDAYERAHHANLFRLHREACSGVLAGMPPAAVQAAGSLVVHARRGVRVPVGFAWPDWAADRTPQGTWIRAGLPVCTVLAEGPHQDTVRRLLAWRQEAILSALEPLVGNERTAPVRRAAGRRSSGGRPSRDGPDAIAQPEIAP